MQRDMRGSSRFGILFEYSLVLRRGRGYRPPPRLAFASIECAVDTQNSTIESSGSVTVERFR